VEGDPAEVVVAEGRQPGADLGGEQQRTPSHTGNGIYLGWYRKGSSIRTMLAGQATASSRSSPARRCSSRSRSARVKHQANGTAVCSSRRWKPSRRCSTSSRSAKPWGVGPCAGGWTGRSRPGSTRRRGPEGAPAAGSASPPPAGRSMPGPDGSCRCRPPRTPAWPRHTARFPSPARPAGRTARCRWWPGSGRTAGHLPPIAWDSSTPLSARYHRPHPHSPGVRLPGGSPGMGHLCWLVAHACCR
jgi:hypothetical protein